MEFLVNDLSIHEQFRNPAEFRDALVELMTIRSTAKRFGREIHCHREFMHSKPIPDMPLQQAIGNFKEESERRAVMAWLGRSGPFWEDIRQHGKDDWLECFEDIVTDTALGEAAFRTLHSVKCGVVSVAPSDWLKTPLVVTWHSDHEGKDSRYSDVTNVWDVRTLEKVLQSEVQPPRSWEELRKTSTSRFQDLTFTSDCFTPLSGVPFSKAAADRLICLLDILDNFTCAFDEDGARNAEGHRMYQEYFSGSRALFSDSSETEKQRFCNEMTFTHPEDSSKTMFCPWHGKVSRSTLRLHFSWPVSREKPVYVVYAGPKITKR